MLLLDLIDSLEYYSLKQYFSQVIVESLGAETCDTTCVTDDRVAVRSFTSGSQLIHQALFLLRLKLTLMLVRRCLLKAVSDGHVPAKRTPLNRRH